MTTPLKVLIVEDSADDATLLIFHLERAGYVLDHRLVSTEKEMQAALDQHDWEIVISDYSLPGFGGLAALKMVRDRGLDIPFIIVSGVIGEETAVAAMKAGAQDYLMKGNLFRLVPAIERELREVEMRRERVKTAAILKETERKLLTLLSNLPGMAYRCRNDEHWTMEFVSDGCWELTGYKPEDIIGNKTISYQQLIHPDHRQEVNDKIQISINENAPFELTYRIVTSSQQVKWVLEKGRMVDSPQGQVQMLEGFISDITEGKKREEELKATLAQKDVLVKEVHHRVKNNLQVIYSLLNLQSGYVKDPLALDMFKECRDRVKSMAIIHEILYQAKDVSKVDFGEYVRTLVGHLKQSYLFQATPIEIKIDVAPMMLNLDVAVPCGLIINELVSNSLKYAFPEGRKGVIEINLHQPEEGKYNLVIRDDGVGFPDDIDFYHTETLGLQLVNTLTDQLEGTIELIRGRGTQFVLTFGPLDKKKEESDHEGSSDSGG
ncbi:MAG: PAS domain-containing protein [Phycisphaerae bacterium]|jgi:PAS domain S-box-containing protein|nr:PAS domain-containing protein [Phycisphaerae bacterium]